MDPNAALTLLFVALAAFAAPFLSRRLGMPAAVGEMLLGVLLGMSGFVEETELLDAFAQLGLIVLMFVAGYEIDFDRIEREGLKGFAVAGLYNALVLALSVGAAVVFKLSVFQTLGVIAISVGVGAAVLKEKGALQTRGGQTFLLVASVGEFLTIILLTVAAAFKGGVSLRTAWNLLGLGVIAGFTYAFLRLLVAWVARNPAKIVYLADAYDTVEITLRAGLAVALLFVAVAALFGIEPVLGAFLAGAVFAFVMREKEVLQEKLSAVGFGFLIPIFFVNVGMHLELHQFFDLGLLGLLGLLLLVSVAVKLLPSPLLVFEGINLRRSAGIGFLLASPLTLLVVIGEVGDEPVLVALAILLGLVAPWLAGKLLVRCVPEG